MASHIFGIVFFRDVIIWRLYNKTMPAPFKRADKNARLRCAKNCGHDSLPDTTDIVVVSLIVVGYEAVTETHVPRAVCTADVGRGRPEPVAWHVGEI